MALEILLSDAGETTTTNYTFGILITGGVSPIPNFPADPSQRTPRFFPVYAYDPVSGIHYWIENFIDGTFAFSHAPNVVLAEAARLMKEYFK